MAAHNFIDLTGKTFGKLTVISRAPNAKKDKHIIPCWNCICECKKELVIRGGNLKSGNTKSCGCFRIITSHRMSSSSEYLIWQKMKQRCAKKSDSTYHNYGGRGISVCNRWLNSFDSFYADMGNRPSKKYSIDRIDNDGNYEPDNCRWATAVEQARNRRVRSDNKCGVSGVRFMDISRKWRAEIAACGPKIYLGQFDTFENAVRARKYAEKKYW